MFSDLRTFLKLFGVLKYNANHSNIPPWFLQLFIVLFSLASQLLFIVGCLLYCFHNLDFIETIKVAGYAYNTSLCCAVIYIYLVYNRENCLRLIDSWDQLIQNSTNYYFKCILSWILNKIFFFVGTAVKKSMQSHYSERKEKLSKLCQRIFSFTLCIFGSMVMVYGIFVPIVNIALGHMDPSTWPVIYENLA